MSEQEIHDRKIVRAQVPQHIGVTLHQAEIDSHRIKVEQFAQLSGINQRLHPPHRCGVLKGVVHHQGLAFACCGFNQVNGLQAGGGHRLFHQHMFTGQQGLFGKFVVS